MKPEGGAGDRLSSVGDRPSSAGDRPSSVGVSHLPPASSQGAAQTDRPGGHRGDQETETLLPGAGIDVQQVLDERHPNERCGGTRRPCTFTRHSRGPS